MQSPSSISERKHFDNQQQLNLNQVSEQSEGQENSPSPKIKRSKNNSKKIDNYKVSISISQKNNTKSKQVLKNDNKHSKFTDYASLQNARSKIDQLCSNSNSQSSTINGNALSQSHKNRKSSNSTENNKHDSQNQQIQHYQSLRQWEQQDSKERKNSEQYFINPVHNYKSEQQIQQKIQNKNKKNERKVDLLKLAQFQDLQQQNLIDINNFEDFPEMNLSNIKDEMAFSKLNSPSVFFKNLNKPTNYNQQIQRYEIQSTPKISNEDINSNKDIYQNAIQLQKYNSTQSPNFIQKIIQSQKNPKNKLRYSSTFNHENHISPIKTPTLGQSSLKEKQQELQNKQQNHKKRESIQQISISKKECRDILMFKVFMEYMQLGTILIDENLNIHFQNEEMGKTFTDCTIQDLLEMKNEQANFKYQMDLIKNQENIQTTVSNISQNIPDNKDNDYQKSPKSANSTDKNTSLQDQDNYNSPETQYPSFTQQQQLNPPSLNKQAIQQLKNNQDQNQIRNSILVKNIQKSNSKNVKFDLNYSKQISDITSNTTQHPTLKSQIFHIFNNLNESIKKSSNITYEILDMRYNMLLSKKKNTNININSNNNNNQDDQEVNIYEVTIIPCVRDKIPACIIFFKDITHFNELKVLKSLNDNKTKMLQNVTHEFRTPLNCIMSMLQVVKSQISQELAQNYVDPALNNAQQLLYLLQDLLDFAQIKNGKFKINIIPFNIKMLLLDIKQTINTEAQLRNINFSVEVQQNVPETIYSDPNRIRQIIINLIGNAMKFTPEQGFIKVLVEMKSNCTFKVSVQDSGIGIKKEDIANLCKEFGKIQLEKDQTHLNVQGVGLGLMISNTLAKNLLLPLDSTGLQIESVKDKGSTFSFLFLDHQIYETQNYSNNNQISTNIQNSKNIIQLNGQNQFFSQPSLNKFTSTQEIPSENQNSINPLKLITKNKGQSILYSQQIVSVNQNSNNILFLQNYKTNNQISSQAIINSIKDEDLNGIQNKISKSQSNQENLKNIESPKSINTNVQQNSNINTVKLTVDQTIKNSKKQVEQMKEFNQNKQCDCPSILIVDDDVYIQLALQKQVSALGFTSESATTVNKAKELIKKRLESNCCQIYKVIFTDYNIGNSNGIILFEEMHHLFTLYNLEQYPSVFCCSGQEDQETISKCHEIGMSGYLVKPVLRDQIIQILSTYIIDTYMR